MAIAAQIAGCSSDDSSPAGPAGDSGTDATKVDSGPTGCSGPLQVMTVKGADGKQTAPDWSCYESDAGFLRPLVALDDGGDAADGDDGATTDDGGGDASDATTGTDASTDAASDGGSGDGGGGQYVLNVTEFVTHQPAGNVSIDMFWGASVAGTAAFTGTTDATGLLPFPTPPSTARTLSFKATGTGYYPVYFYNTPIQTPPAQTIGYAITANNTQVLVASVLGSQPLASNKTILVGAARDCQNREVKNAVLDLIDDDTQQPVPTSNTTGGARSFYFDDQGLPNPICTFTSNGSQAVWAMLNAPVNMNPDGTKTHSYSLRFSGRRTDADTSAVVMNAIPVELWLGVGNVPRPYKQTPPQ